jgi:hypothetical protein
MNSHLHILATTGLHNQLFSEAEKFGIPVSQYVRIKLGEEYDLNEKAFEVLKKCRKNNYDTIVYKHVYTNLCRHFSITKEECRALLRRFEKEGRIKYVMLKGIRIVSS